MSRIASRSTEHSLPWLEARRTGVAQLLQSLKLSERQELGQVRRALRLEEDPLLVVRPQPRLGVLNVSVGDPP